MAKYDWTVTVSEAGKPDATARLCCADEACFLDCQRALLQSGSDFLAWRASHPHDVALAAKGGCPCSKTVLGVDVLRDGAPHLCDQVTFHDLPTAAGKELARLFKAFLSVPCVAACKVP